MYKFKFKPSRKQAKEFAILMDEIYEFCREHGIDASRDSCYFIVNGQKYRVSNHSVETSNAHSNGRYHCDGRRDDTIYIHASKTRIIEIYNNLVAGKKLNGRGEII